VPVSNDDPILSVNGLDWTDPTCSAREVETFFPVLLEERASSNVIQGGL
jgi:hypothetical protein